MENEYKPFIVQEDDVCWACGKEMPKGSSCFVDEDNTICCADCYNKWEAQGDIALESSLKDEDEIEKVGKDGLTPEEEDFRIKEDDDKN
jgi:hypothetical protein